MSKFLIAGLGNPGNEYANTRHNIGFDVVNAFVQNHGCTLDVGRLANIAEVRWKGKQLICICPTTYVNLSGRAFKYWMDKEKVPLENTLTILDDLALPLDKLRLRPGGSHAGHNGLKNIQQVLETDKYPRLRFGIGSNYPQGMQVDFVLGKWLPAEVPVVKLKLQKCIEIIENFTTKGIEKTMAEVNNLSIHV